MNIHHVLVFCCLSALSDRNARLTNAQLVFTKSEGEDFRHNFTVKEAESSRKYLCKNNCEKEDILVETRGNRAQSGRYVIRYGSVLHVVITALTQSDAGRYRVGVSNSSSLGPFWDFEIRVRDQCDGGVIYREPRGYSSAEGGNVTIRCSLSAAERNRKFLCRDKCQKVLFETIAAAASSDRYSIEHGSSRFFDVTITQLTKSDSGRYRCGVGRRMSQNICQEFEITVTDGYTVPLVVCLTMIVLSVISLLLLYKWKRRSTTCLNNRRTSTSRNTEFGPYDNAAPASTLEDPTYETFDSHHYETLNQHNSAHDQMYSTLSEQT